MSKKTVAAAAVFGVVCAAAAVGQEGTGLIVAAQSDRMVWNGVVVIGGRVIVSGPRWAGGSAPALAIVGKGGLTAYPDTAWNDWKPGEDPAKAFVNVNAIHLAKDGALWVIDTGSPEFGGDPLPGGAKAVKINLSTNRIERIYSLGLVVLPGSYVDDLRVNRDHAYLTDAGKTPGIIVLNLISGAGRRVLEDVAAVKATPGRNIILGGRTIKAPNGKPLVVNADPLDLSIDGRYFYFGPMSGPWSRIETRLLDDPSQSAAALRSGLEPWADLPPIGGAIMDADDSLYFSELSSNSVKRRAPDGTITTIVSDSRLHWVDAPFIDSQRNLWLPVPQLDRAPPFNGGISRVIQPITLYRYKLPPANQDDRVRPMPM
jgi:Major royal jelly protein